MNAVAQTFGTVAVTAAIGNKKAREGPSKGGRGHKTFGGRRTKAMEVSLFQKTPSQPLSRSAAGVGQAKHFSNEFPHNFTPSGLRAVIR